MVQHDDLNNAVTFFNNAHICVVSDISQGLGKNPKPCEKVDSERVAYLMQTWREDSVSEVLHVFRA